MEKGCRIIKIGEIPMRKKSGKRQALKESAVTGGNTKGGVL